MIIAVQVPFNPSLAKGQSVTVERPDGRVHGIIRHLEKTPENNLLLELEVMVM